MNTPEVIGLCASVIGIGAFISGLIKYLFRPYFKRREDLLYISEIIISEFARWKEFGKSARAETFLIGEKFILIDKYRNRLKNIPSEQLLYLFGCSIQNGMKGNWSKWLYLNTLSKDLVCLLFTTLNRRDNLRPKWRSAFILQYILGGEEFEIKKLCKNETDSDLYEAIQSMRVKEYLRAASFATADETLRSKMNLVLQEFDYFEKDVAMYASKIDHKKLLNILASVN